MISKLSFLYKQCTFYHALYFFLKNGKTFIHFCSLIRLKYTHPLQSLYAMQFAEKETRQKPNLFQVYITHWVKTPHSGWLTELAGSAAHSADVFTWVERQTGRDGEWGRQKDVASASRLKSNWFVFFSEDVWAWLVAHVLTADRKQSCFHSTKSLRLFVRSLNFALVRSLTGLFPATSVSVEETLYAVWV